MILRKIHQALLFLLCCAIVISCSNQEKATTSTERSLTGFVDPFIGTGAHGHVFLGANVPFGAVQLGPVNLSEGWDWCSGYNYSDSTIIGFAHTHLSGTGIGDLGDILVMPVTGDASLHRGVSGKPGTGFGSLFSHDNEEAIPGYYSVFLKRYNIRAELTATQRVGFHQYTFPAADSASIIIDLGDGIGWDSPIDNYIKQVDDTTVVGYRFSKGWAHDQRVYFTMIFSQPLRMSYYDFDSAAVFKSSMGRGKQIGGYLTFKSTHEKKIKIKVGISPVSAENALDNIRTELPGWDFDATVKSANEAWNKELNKIRIQANDSARLKTFYTALYHTMIAPSIFNDHNGDYLGTDKKVYRNAPFTNLTTFSLWDTYRAAHPLYTIFQPERVNDMINSMLAIYQQQGKLPVWHLMGNETNTMPGYSSVQVIADAYIKGFRGFDTSLAWEAVKSTAMLDERGLSFVKKYGYIPADTMVESVAMGLEYAIADWAIAQMAKRMNKTKDYAYFNNRASFYRNYFDSSVKFMRGRIGENKWREPFSPFKARHMKDDFTEGNAWQYTWLVPQDVEGLIRLLGGEKPFTEKLDSFFVVTGDMGKEASADITGLIGQYAHGNEPSHHIAYLYNYVGQPWKAADKIRYILDSLYSDKTDGLCGNEDVGQMSAWYVLSALGIYQVNPSNGLFVIGSPVVDDALFTFDNDKTFHIIVKDNSKQNKYVQDIKLNGKEYPYSYLLYKELVNGGEMIIEMGASPSKNWGVNPSSRPYSTIK